MRPLAPRLHTPWLSSCPAVVGANDSGKITDSLPWMVCSRIALKMVRCRSWLPASAAAAVAALPLLHVASPTA